MVGPISRSAMPNAVSGDIAVTDGWGGGRGFGVGSGSCSVSRSGRWG